MLLNSTKVSRVKGLENVSENSQKRIKSVEG